MPRLLFTGILCSLLFTGLSGKADSALDKSDPAAPLPKTVTLPDSSLSKALQTLRDQTGIAIVNQLGSDSDPVLKLSLKNSPFWPALDTVAERAGGRLDLYRGDGRIGLTTLLKADKTEKQPISYSGIFRVALRRLVAVRDFETGGRSYRVSLDVAWEPTFQAFYLETQPQKLQMLDAANKPLRLSPAGKSWAPIDGRTALLVDVSLPALPRSADRIGLLSGTFPIRAPSRMLTFSFDQLDHLGRVKDPVVKAAGGVSVAVSDVKLGKRRWTVRVTTRLPPGGPKFDSSQPWDVNNEIYLMHKDGKTRLGPTGYNRDTAGSSPRAVLNYLFEDSPTQKLGKPGDWSLVYRAPASIIEVAIPFTFKEIALP